MWLTTLALILMGLLFGYGIYIYRKRRARKFFYLRDLLTDDEIISCFYSETSYSEKEILELWSEVARIFDLPYGLLRPSDRFGEELHGYWLVDNEISELSQFATNKLKEKGKSADLSNISNLGELIEVLLHE